ncbi:MAG: fumarylacetoacetate hydrolase family protein [Leptospira sp.]|nr:fumarylacetoacetate hydrolase family protein [Leptospira sp.]
MAMQIIRFESKGKINWGRVADGKIYPLPGNYPTLSELIQKGTGDLKSKKIKSGKAIPVGDPGIKILSPVTEPCSILCLGKNYSDHRLETGHSAKKPPFNTMFMKASSSLSPANGNVVRPKGIRLLDYELELGLVIGKEIRGPVSKDRWQDYIFGFTMALDMSARDIQIPQEQWFKGKSYRSFCPVGPYLVLLERNDFAKLPELELHLEVNGKTRQKSRFGQVLFGPEETLVEASEIMNLFPGDIILTGTPGGVAMQLPPPWIQKLVSFLFSNEKRMSLFLERQLKLDTYLKNGDVIRSSIKIDGSNFSAGELNLTITEKK